MLKVEKKPEEKPQTLTPPELEKFVDADYPAEAQKAGLEGNVTLVEPGSKFKGRARLRIRFHTLVMSDGLRVPIQTDALYRDGESASRSTATKVGTGAVAGAVLGAVLGGKRGAILGAGAGAGGGTVAVMAGDAKEAVIESGTQLTMRVVRDVKITVERE